MKFFFILHFSFFICMCRAAEEFGDVSVEPHAMFTGNTFHGYGEMRVALENRSYTKPHTVTLIYPNNSYNNGNSIGGVARTVKLPPDAREIVSLLQPALPAQGDGQIRVQIDGRHEGEVRAPNANNHCNFGYSYGRNNQAVVFVSRSLDFDAVNNLMQPEGIPAVVVSGGGSNPAAQAVGEPRAFAGGSKDLSLAWMPEWRGSRGGSHWLEVDYAPTQTVDKITIHSVQSPLGLGTVKIVGVSGTNLLTLPMTSASNLSTRGKGWNVEFTFTQTVEPAKTVRIEFGALNARSIAIDGVQISGPAGSQWATNARASSENKSPSTTTSYPPIGISTPGRPGVENIECLRAESPVSGWSENWLAYTPFDAVVLSAADVSTLPPGVSSALADYLFAGGNIFLAGNRELPAAWHAAKKIPLPDGAISEVGFGNAFAAENFLALDQASLKKLRDLVHESARYWQSLPADSGAANAALQVVENLKIPTRA